VKPSAGFVGGVIQVSPRLLYPVLFAVGHGLTSAHSPGCQFVRHRTPCQQEDAQERQSPRTEAFPLP
jgi:hypothetical protein